MSFLLQSKREEDAEIKECLKNEMFTMIKSLIESLSLQQSE